MLLQEGRFHPHFPLQFSCLETSLAEGFAKEVLRSIAAPVPRVASDGDNHSEVPLRVREDLRILDARFVGNPLKFRRHQRLFGGRKRIQRSHFPAGPDVGLSAVLGHLEGLAHLRRINRRHSPGHTVRLRRFRTGLLGQLLGGVD